MVGYVVYSKER